jgi:PPK2 family polyphosphate:nucleotide phosphotransferase
LRATALLQSGIEQLAKYQDMLYAQHTHALLIILQAMDAAGKDGVIKHVMSGVNPQGCQVHSFKAPSAEELSHDYMWRCFRKLPERGLIGIFNRSYYEEVLVVRVHRELLERQPIPPELKGKGIWKRRFEEINCFERYLANNGIQLIKLYLNLSKEEQHKRFLARIERPEKNWKFSTADARERAHWDEYMEAYEDVLVNTSTEWAPWYVVPADIKWFARLIVSNIICSRLESLGLRYPDVDDEHRKEISSARVLLEKEATGK